MLMKKAICQQEISVDGRLFFYLQEIMLKFIELDYMILLVTSALIILFRKEGISIGNTIIKKIASGGIIC